MMKTSFKSFFAIAAVAGVAFIMSMAPARALTVDLTFSNAGPVGQSTLFRADLTGLGLSVVSSITLIDIDVSGGADGVFSGFDLDALVLDRDGDLATTDDQFSPFSLEFQAGSQRPTTNQNQLAFSDGGTNPAVDGPVFGADDATTINPGQSTLDAFDAVSSDNVNTAAGFLTFGDDGQLIANFADIAIGDSLFLLIAEVGGQAGEEVMARVSQVPLPGAVWLFLTGLMALIGFTRRRKIVAA